METLNREVYSPGGTMPNRIPRMVVGVAGMDDQDPRTPGGADPVLGPAVRLATDLGAELHAVHAFEVPAELSAGVFSPSGPNPAAAWESELEERLERQLGGIPGGDAVHCWAVEGPAAEALCRTAAEVDAELIVVGASRRGRAWAGILGSTASRVIATSALPVLVVHRPFARAAGRVLLTSDLSAASPDALRRGAAAARRLLGGAAQLRCLHVVDLDPMIAPPAADEVLQAVASARLERSLPEAGLDAMGVECRVRVGDAGREIAREAQEWDADLLVVGTHGRTGPQPGGAGSVAVAAVRGAPCNVLVIPAFTVAPAAPRDAGWGGAARVARAALAAAT
jgi:nucleotide-binding universal stress UspA family protein